jgi:hypothetical protein
MKRRFSVAALGVAGGVGAFCVSFASRAAEPASPTANIRAAAAPGKGTPKIQFETNFFDFGRVVGAEPMSGVFKFKNIGDGILKVDPPQPSCDCTDSKVKPDKLAPGESGEIMYTIKLDHPLNGQRNIRVHSNDPDTPNVQLTMQMDYKPLYEVSSATLLMTLPAGKDEAQRSFTVTRVDGKPPAIDRLAASQEWISAATDPAFQGEENTARIKVTVRRPPGPPAPINATLQLWSKTQPSGPVRTVNVAGEILGELAADPPRFYWVIPDLGKSKSDYPEGSLTRKVELRSVLGNPVEIKSATSNIKGMSVQVVAREPGKRFELVLKFEELPQEFSNGKVTIETSLASLPKLEVPVTVAVPQ